MAPDGEHFWFSGNLVTLLHADGWTLLESNMRTGHAPPSRIHRNEDEAFHVLDGSMSFVRDGEFIDLVAGDSIVVPRGVPHAFRVGPNGARARQVATGPGWPSSSGRPVCPLGLRSSQPRRGSTAMRWPGAAERHDMLVVGPPLD